MDALLSTPDPLDEQEQQQVIAELEAQAVLQARTFRRLCGGVALALATFFAYAAAQQQLHPWEQQYTGELRPVTSALSVATVLAVQASALATAGLGLLWGMPRPTDRGRGCIDPSQTSHVLLWASLAAAGVGFCYWGAAMYRSIAKYGHAVGAKWELFWLPLGPLAYCALCWQVLSSLAGTSRELAELRRLAYSHKKV